MLKFRKLNNIFGWVIFFIASFTYTLTLEPTVSFWDCGEWIASSYKLEVGHPPGAPVYQLLAHVFSWFSAGDVSKVALAMNMLSALASAFAVMFLFWTITLLLKKFLNPENNAFAILVSAATGALSFCFSDSFWFSAVESEVYALSSMFIAVMFWAVLRWTEDRDARWLLLTALLLGLSEGVHFLGFLVIPSVVMVVFYEKSSTFDWKILLAGLLVSAGVLLLVFKLIVPGTFWLFAKTNLFFVNECHLTVNLGMAISAVFMIMALAAGTVVGIRKRRRYVELSFLALAFFMVGLSPNFITILRSQADTPINEGAPDNPVAFLNYWQRDMYKQAPLLYGPYFTAPIAERADKAPTMELTAGSSGRMFYETVDDGKNADYVYAEDFCTFFPRMWDAGAAEYYPTWCFNTGEVVDYQGNGIYRPSFIDNVEFFFSFQVGHSYLRYFLWNFAGKFDDNQGFGSIHRGACLSGVPPFDKLITGTYVSEIPESLQNKGRNGYFMLPLILGIVGLFRHFGRDRKSAWATFVLFFVTSIGLVFYLNSSPYEPRERDYVFVTSFYVFAVWIGFGANAVFSFLEKRKILLHKPLKILTALLLTCVPALMAFQNWDDHDRSGRRTARDAAYNILQSCEKNAVLFCQGDNDTFPLWYLQEVEGIRTDVRIVNLSLLSTSWYIDQCRKDIGKNHGFEMAFSEDQYRGRKRQTLFPNPLSGEEMPLEEMICYVANDSNSITYIDGADYFRIPASALSIPVNRRNFEKQTRYGCSVPVPDTMRVGLPPRLNRSDLIHYNIILSNNWERPVYYTEYAFAKKSELHGFLRKEGLTYRLTPFEKNVLCADSVHFGIDSEIMLDHIMNRFSWSNLSNVYVDETSRRFLDMTLQAVSELSSELVKNQKSREACRLWNRVNSCVPPEMMKNRFRFFMMEAYFENGCDAATENLARDFGETLVCEINYYNAFGESMKKFVQEDLNADIEVLQQFATLLQKHGRTDLLLPYIKKIKTQP